MKKLIFKNDKNNLKKIFHTILSRKIKKQTKSKMSNNTETIQNEIKFIEIAELIKKYVNSRYELANDQQLIRILNITCVKCKCEHWGENKHTQWKDMAGMNKHTYYKVMMGEIRDEEFMNEKYDEVYEKCRKESLSEEEEEKMLKEVDRYMDEDRVIYPCKRYITTTENIDLITKVIAFTYYSQDHSYSEATQQFAKHMRIKISKIQKWIRNMRDERQMIYNLGGTWKAIVYNSDRCNYYCQHSRDDNNKLTTPYVYSNVTPVEIDGFWMYIDKKGDVCYHFSKYIDIEERSDEERKANLKLVEAEKLRILKKYKSKPNHIEDQEDQEESDDTDDGEN